MRDKVYRAPRDKYVRLTITISFSSTIRSLARLRPLNHNHKGKQFMRGTPEWERLKVLRKKKSVLILIFQICVFLFFFFFLVNAIVFFFLSSYFLNSIWFFFSFFLLFFLSATILWQFLLKGRTAIAIKNCFSVKQEKFGAFRKIT